MSLRPITILTRQRITSSTTNYTNQPGGLGINTTKLSNTKLSNTKLSNTKLSNTKLSQLHHHKYTHIPQTHQRSMHQHQHQQQQQQYSQPTRCLDTTTYLNTEPLHSGISKINNNTTTTTTPTTTTTRHHPYYSSVDGQLHLYHYNRINSRHIGRYFLGRNKIVINNNQNNHYSARCFTPINRSFSTSNTHTITNPSLQNTRSNVQQLPKQGIETVLDVIEELSPLFPKHIKLKTKFNFSQANDVLNFVQQNPQYMPKKIPQYVPKRVHNNNNNIKSNISCEKLKNEVMNDDMTKITSISTNNNTNYNQIYQKDSIQYELQHNKCLKQHQHCENEPKLSIEVQPPLIVTTTSPLHHSIAYILSLIDSCINNPQTKAINLYRLFRPADFFTKNGTEKQKRKLIEKNIQVTSGENNHTLQNNAKVNDINNNVFSIKQFEKK